MAKKRKKVKAKKMKKARSTGRMLNRLVTE